MTTVTSHAVALRLARRYAVRNMVDQVRIVRPAAVDDHGDVTVPTTAVTGSVVYTGRARVRVVGGASPTDVADELTFLATSGVSIPVQDDPPFTQVNDLVVVTNHRNNDLVGAVLRVIGVDTGGQFPVVRSHTVTVVVPAGVSG